jgi:hypothetical protein
MAAAAASKDEHRRRGKSRRRDAPSTAGGDGPAFPTFALLSGADAL